MTAPDRPTREQTARSITDRIDWTPTVLAGGDARMAIVEQVLRLAEHEARAEVERKVSVDVRMERPPAPDWGGEEDDNGVQLYHHAWDSTDGDLRLWVGPYAAGDSGPWWAVTVQAPGIDVTMRCEPDDVVEWAEMVKEAVTDGPALAARTPQPAEPTTGDLLRAAAAGRREYAEGCGDARTSTLKQMHDVLLTQAATLDTAARVADGDMNLLYGWLPSWRWTAAMTARVDSGSATTTTRSDVAALVPSAPLPAVLDGEDERVSVPRAQLRGWYDVLDSIGSVRAIPLSAANQLGETAGSIAYWAQQAPTPSGLPVAPEPGATPAGEDAPARLDAAAEVLNRHECDATAQRLRDAAAALRAFPADVRAAVAAALARPTEANRG